MNPRLVETADKIFIAECNETDPVKRAVLERRLFMIKYGHISEQQSLIEHLKYNTNDKDYFHPWSKWAVGSTFGAREYVKYIPLMDYFNSPADLIEDILEGVVEGEQAALKAKAEAAKRVAAQQSNKDPHMAAIKQAQKGK